MIYIYDTATKQHIGAFLSWCEHAASATVQAMRAYCRHFALEFDNKIVAS